MHSPSTTSFEFFFEGHWYAAQRTRSRDVAGYERVSAVHAAMVVDDVARRQPWTAAALRGLSRVSAHESASDVARALIASCTRLPTRDLFLWRRVKTFGRDWVASEAEPVDLTELMPEAAEHWIELEILGREEAPVVGTRCTIEAPGSRPFVDRTAEDGRVYRGDLPKEGDCWVTLPDVDAAVWDEGSVKETKLEEAPWHWLQLVVTDSRGFPVADLECTIEVPNEDPRTVRSDGEGRIWVQGLESADDCTISFPELDGDAWELET
ncbi:MAG: hypothetical protein AAF721_07245 [Myxococcota bacterium]